MDTRREFIKKAAMLSGGTGLLNVLPASIQKALAIDPAAGSTYLDAEHIVFLMQENRSFDHTYGTLQGVRGFNDPRAIQLPNKNPVWLQTNKEGATYAPFRLDMKGTKATWMSSLPHSWGNQVDARNNGKYDKWLDVKHSGHKEYAAMPLTMGYYNRADIPFYYSLADAFTVCDQHFCSSLTGTTPNRLYFWTGTIREKQAAQAVARVWNEDADYDTMVSWTTFPERLEDLGVSWKVYQNELSVGVGFKEEEEAWLANFGDNPLEYFTQYQVKLSAGYIDNLPKAAIALAADLKKQQTQLASLAAGSDEAKKAAASIAWLQKAIVNNAADQKTYTKEKYQQLSQREKNLHEKAFDTNKQDPAYHQLTSLKYHDGQEERELKVPAGDVLHQLRKDVNNGSLPAVSWVVAPENFSDHPSSAWFGAWYISEVMDILTKNPEVWKKTIFIITYDENDGYFDHVPPFVPPHPNKPGTGSTSPGIDAGLEYVASADQQRNKEHARESPIGLGFRVPMVVVSPWSRGGWVCSEVFDHTSSLQFLEKFLSNKLSKKVEEPNISQWRRTVCGDLTSAFRPYNGEKINTPVPVQRDAFIESIHKAKFKDVPVNFKALTAAEIEKIKSHPQDVALLPVQEKGTRSSCALPYELYADGQLSADKKSFGITFKAGNDIFGERAAGSPFQVYAPGVYMKEAVRTWDFAVKAGDSINYQWLPGDFENNRYQLHVHGPNGFFRAFTGNSHDPALDITCLYEKNKIDNRKLTGNIVLRINNTSKQDHVIEITDNAYKNGTLRVAIDDAFFSKMLLPLPKGLAKSHGWYDFTVRIKGNTVFERRYAGRVETGLPSITDPAMGKVV
jgi:phospholipase C